VIHSGGFQHLVRVTRPGGIFVISLYNAYNRRVLRTKQALCKLLGGNDVDQRATWGKRFVP
jgi:hypothetical protein